MKTLVFVFLHETLHAILQIQQPLTIFEGHDVAHKDTGGK